MSLLQIFNRQKTRAINLPLLRKISRGLLDELLEENVFELGIHLVGAEEMAQVNKNFLQHEGSTDVITFDYSETGRAGCPQPAARGAMRTSRPTTPLLGEIFISVDDAVSQAREFRTSWQSELVRYIVHGVLHLEGHDDLQPAPRLKMKRAENRLLKELSRRFDLGKLERTKKSCSGGL